MIHPRNWLPAGSKRIIALWLGIFVLAVLSLTRIQRGMPIEFPYADDDGYYLLYSHNLLYQGSLHTPPLLYDLGRPPRCTPNPYSVGMTWFLLPIGLGIRLLSALTLPECTGGACREVFAMFGGVSGGFSFGGLLLLALTLRQRVSTAAAITAAAAITLTTIIPYYIFFRPLMAHGAEFFFFAAILCALDTLLDGPLSRLGDFFFGGLIGAFLITRYQDGIWLPTFLLLWGFATYRDASVERSEQILKTACLLSGLFIGILPQLLFWVVQRGGLPSSIDNLYGTGGGAHDPLQQSLSAYFGLFPGWAGRLRRVLWGPGFGFFSMTPITLLGVAGVAWLKDRKNVMRSPWKYSVVLLMVIPAAALALLTSNSVEMSYGHRYMVTAYVLCAPGIALVLEWATRQRLKAVKVGTWIFVLWLGLIGLGSYWLFHSNKDTLTLTTDHPVFELGHTIPQGWLDNPHYDRNALAVMRRRPLQPVLTVAASLTGYATYLLIRQQAGPSKGRTGFLAKFLSYYEEHVVAPRVVVWYLLGLAMGVFFGGLAAFLLSNLFARPV